MEAVEEKKLISFDKGAYEEEVSRLSARLKFLQSVLDAYHGLQLGSLTWPEYLEMLKDVDSFVRAKVLKDFNPKIEGVELDLEQIKQFVKMPDIFSVQMRIDILFKSEYYTQFKMNASMYYDIVNGRVVLTNLDEIRAKYSRWVANPEDEQRLKLVQKLADHYQKMYDSGLWPEIVFKQAFSLFIDVEAGIQPNPHMIVPGPQGFPTGQRARRHF